MIPCLSTIAITLSLLMSAIGGFTYIQWFSQGPQRSNRAFSESRKSQFRRKSTSEKQTVLSSDGEFSLMSFNVQEFFEPCMDVVRSWEKSSKTDTSIHAFAKTHPGVLDQQFVAENARRRMSWSACKNMSDSQWDAGVSLVRSVIVESDADVIALQEFAVTRIDIVPAGYRVALVSSTGEPGWKDRRLGNAVLVRSSWEVLSTEALDLELGEAVPRSAACATVGAPAPTCFQVKVCSVHLSGGRFVS